MDLEVFCEITGHSRTQENSMTLKNGLRDDSSRQGHDKLSDSMIIRITVYWEVL